MKNILGTLIDVLGANGFADAFSKGMSSLKDIGAGSGGIYQPRRQLKMRLGRLCWVYWNSGGGKATKKCTSGLSHRKQANKARKVASASRKYNAKFA